MTTLEPTARRWVEQVHPHPDHLVRARDWVVQLDARASKALRVAALVHDIERAFPDPASPFDSALDWDNPRYTTWHQDRSARLAGEWLAERGIDRAAVAEITELVAVHEEGGWADANILQAADSLSFLETLVPVTIKWVQRGVPIEVAVAKLRWMAARIQIPAARATAEPLLEAALRRLRAGL